MEEIDWMTAFCDALVIDDVEIDGCELCLTREADDTARLWVMTEADLRRAATVLTVAADKLRAIKDGR